MKLFVYGTLLDSDIRRVVIGREIPAENISAATIQRFYRVQMPGCIWPMLRPHHRVSRVDGLLLEGLSAEDIRCLIVFEGDEYRLVPTEVTDSGGRMVRVSVFLGNRSVPPGQRSWNPRFWARRHKVGFLRRVTALMGSYGTRSQLRRLPCVRQIARYSSVLSEL